MKLNWDCFRDTLLAIKEASEINSNSYELNYLPISNIITKLKDYSLEDVAYALLKLSEIRYIESDMLSISDKKDTRIKDITFLGHKYLRDLRDNLSCTFPDTQ